MNGKVHQSLLLNRHVGIPSLISKWRRAGVTLYQHMVIKKYSTYIFMMRRDNIFLKIHFSEIFETNIRHIYSEKVNGKLHESLLLNRHVGVPSLRRKCRCAGVTFYWHMKISNYSTYIVLITRNMNFFKNSFLPNIRNKNSTDIFIISER